jgi:uncharacterized protein (DUF488 family)
MRVSGNPGTQRSARAKHATGRIYSVGYEGFDVEALAERLASSKVSIVVDVRLNPSSRKAGFSKKALSAALAHVGVAYEHSRELGNPVDNRDSFRRGDGEEGRRRMREMLENGSKDAVEGLAERARNGRIAVLCVERERSRCHRHVITEMVQEIEPTIEVFEIL